MATILALAGSNSSTSINFKLVKYTLSCMEGYTIKTLDMSNLSFAMYSEDLESDKGFSSDLKALQKDIARADGLVLSVNEHNGSISAYFKNILDWLSRLDGDFLKGTKIFLMSTSPGKGGAASALKQMENLLPNFGARITGTFSLPSFSRTFNEEKGILETDLAAEHQIKIQQFLAKL